jgi:hypothetical protein
MVKEVGWQRNLKRKSRETRKTSVKETVERDLDVFLVTTKAGS